MKPSKKLQRQQQLHILYESCSIGRVDQAIELLERFRLHAPEVWEEGKVVALHSAVSSAQPAMTRALIAYGVDIEVPDKHGLSTLFQACQPFDNSPDMEAVCLALMDAGAGFTGLYDDGQTLLHAAVSDGFLAVSKRLLQLGSDVNARCNHKGTPLHFAACHQDTRLALLLLRHGAEVDAVNDENLSPLSNALKNWENDELVLVFMAAGAKVDASTQKTGDYQAIMSMSQLAAGVQVGEAWLIEKLIDTDPEPETLDVRLREACLQSEAAAKPVGAHVARSLYASRLSRQWVQEITADPGLQP